MARKRQKLYQSVEEILNMHPTILEDRGYSCFVEVQSKCMLFFGAWDELVNSLMENGSQPLRLHRGRHQSVKSCTVANIFELIGGDSEYIALFGLKFLFFEVLSPTNLMNSIFAGFFVFGQAKDINDTQGFISMEICDEEHVDDEGKYAYDGRIILLDIECLIIGKKSTRCICDCVNLETKQSLKSNDSKAFPCRSEISLNANDIQRVWEMCIEQHGIDWMGLQSMRDAYTKAWNTNTSQNTTLVRFICSYLVNERDDSIVSAQVGVLVGCIYSCLSSYHDKLKYPRIDKVHSNILICQLWRIGVRMIDVGTTAKYYVTLSGFSVVGRREFIRLWRKYRSETLRCESALNQRNYDVGEQNLLVCRNVHTVLTNSRGGKDKKSFEDEDLP